ncbi:MAG: mannosyltransferase [Herpetosiphonaceae bacterium]|nr:MAG: mannosyltransferase [Herpetosiphonaceae bacterium]
MADITASVSINTSTTTAPPVSNSLRRLALAGVLVLATLFSFVRLGQEGYGNLYYAAAVRSMLQSWHHFFFVSFDSGGFVSVDKPPLGLWVQVASVWLLGFSGLSLLLPQALAGILSVAVLYRLVRRSAGFAAGLLAALLLAVTPISVATNRNNTMDSLLVLLLLLAAWAALDAATTGRLRLLLLCAVFVGLGFNVKMLQAYLVLPALALPYLVSAPLPWRRRVLHLSLAGALLLVVSFAWVLAVDLTPADRRPYVGSSRNNSVLELIIGHNGLSRLFGPGRSLQSGPPPGAPGRPPAGADQPSGSGSSQPVSPSPQIVPAPSGAPGPLSETGEPGFLRLFNRQLGGQASWFLPLALLALAIPNCTVPASGLKPGSAGTLECEARNSKLLWGTWLVSLALFFSLTSGIIHRYYLAMLAPPIAALAGMGGVALWRAYTGAGRSGWLLPLALVICGVTQTQILMGFPAWARWLVPIVLGLSLAVAGTLVVAQLLRRQSFLLWTRSAAAVGALALLIAPAIWAGIPVWYGGDGSLPFAGPELLERPRLARRIAGEKLSSYLLANRRDEAFLAATINAHTAAPLILATGEPVMALGGFSGSDPILTVEELAQQVADGRVRFFLLSGQRGQQADLARWVQEHCVSVDPALWREPGMQQPGMPTLPGQHRQPLSGPGGPPASGMSEQLFDCAGA